MGHLWIVQSISVLWKDKMGFAQVMLGVPASCMVRVATPMFFSHLLGPKFTSPVQTTCHCQQKAVAMWILNSNSPSKNAFPFILFWTHVASRSKCVFNWLDFYFLIKGKTSILDWAFQNGIGCQKQYLEVQEATVLDGSNGSKSLSFAHCSIQMTRTHFFYLPFSRRISPFN